MACFVVQQHSVLTKLSISGLQREAIAFVPGTALFVTHQRVATPTHLDARFDASAEHLRRFELLECERAYIIEALLLSKRFESPRTVARKLTSVWSLMESASVLSDRTRAAWTLPAVKAIVASVAAKFLKSTEEFERASLQLFLLREEILEYLATYASPSPSEANELERVVSLVFQNRDHVDEWFVKQWRRREAETATRSSAEAGCVLPFLGPAAKSLHLVPRQALLTQVQALASGMASATGVVLSGSSGSGKTTAYRMLAAALSLYHQDNNAENAVRPPVVDLPSRSVQPESPRSIPTKSGPSSSIAIERSMDTLVDIHVVLPMALTLTQLYGSTAPDGKGRTKSVLGRLIRLAQEKLVHAAAQRKSSVIAGTGDSDVDVELSPLLATRELLWVVFDGDMDSAWLEHLSCVLTTTSVGACLASAAPQSSVLPFQDGECMTIPPNLRFLFETTSLKNCAPGILRLNALVNFDTSEGNGVIGGGAELKATANGHEPIHRAYICRYLSMRRAEWQDASQSKALAVPTYKLVKRQLLQSELLDTIFAVIQEYGCTVKLTFLQRVVNLLSLLQALLNSTAVAMSHEGSGDSRRLSKATDVDESTKARLKYRVDVVLVYALMWGFAGCVNDSIPLQTLVSSMLKTHFVAIAASWRSCGKDCNLFETVIDIPEARFVSVHHCTATLSASSLSTRQLDAFSSAASTIAPESFSNLSLFVPTHTSVLVHAAMKEALRSGRGVLLVGDENSRRTELLRNFPLQVDCLKTAVHEQKVSNNTGAKTVLNTASGTVPTSGANDVALESVERIRFHQVSLVTALAAKFRRLHHAIPLSVHSSAATSVSDTHTLTASADITDEPPRSCAWTMNPDFSLANAELVAKLDSGDFVPFFFTMTQYTRGVADIAQCLERMLQRERTGVFEPPPGKLAILIIDDLHLPTPDRNDASVETNHCASCHEYLRSAYENARVHTGGEGTAIRVERLLMVASASSRFCNGGSTSCGVETAVPMPKLARQFFPVLAPACTALEVHQMFLTLTLAQLDRPNGMALERLPLTARYTLSLMVAGSVVLWEKLQRLPWAHERRSGTSDGSVLSDTCRAIPRFSLHDLSRVYEGVCSVASLCFLDTEMLLQLWTHENLRSIGDPYALTHPQCHQTITEQIWRLRRIMEAVDHRFDGFLQFDPSGTVAAAAAVAKTPHLDQQRVSDGTSTNLHFTNRYNAVGFLSFLSTELHDKKPATRQPPVAVVECSSMWGFTPADLYFQRMDIAADRGTAASAPQSRALRESSRQLQQQYSSFNFARRRSLDLGTKAWIYAEIVAEDASEQEVHRTVQRLFAGIRAYSTSGVSTQEDAMSTLLAQKLHKAAPQVSRELVRCVCAHCDLLLPSMGAYERTLALDAGKYDRSNRSSARSSGLQDYALGSSRQWPRRVAPVRLRIERRHTAPDRVDTRGRAKPRTHAAQVVLARARAL